MEDVNEEMACLTGETLEEEFTPNSPPAKRQRVVWLGIGVVGLIACAWMIYKAKPQMSTYSENTQDLFDSKASVEPGHIIDFLTSRSLAQVGSVSFGIKCTNDEPVCNPEIEFESQMKKSLGTLKTLSPDIYKILVEQKLATAQQEIILRVLPLLHNKKVLELGQVIAKTVKQWAKSGDAVVHLKVQEALKKFFEERGTAGIPEMDLSQPPEHSTMLEALTEPQLLSQIHSEETRNSAEAQSRQLLSQYNHDEQSTAGDVFGGIGSFLSGPIFLIFQILHRAGAIDIPLYTRVIYMWFLGIVNSIACLPIVSCPFVFLEYWFEAWLLFGKKPRQQKRIRYPWDFMMEKLPGLKSRLLVAADPLIAA